LADAPDLSIVVVNWNVRDCLRDCLLSLRGSAGSPRWETIVVDNASADGSVEMLRAEFPEVRLIASDENLGFAGGCEAGYAVARGGRILLLNPDTVVPPGAVEAMMAAMDEHADAGVVGSRLLNTDGSFQRAAGGAFPTLANMAWNYLFLDRLPFGRGPAPVFLRDDRRDVFDIDWVSGAAMLIRREAVGQRIFDPAYFMFGEDMDLCDRVRQAGWRVLYSGRQAIVHHHGRSFSAQSSLEVLANVYRGPRRFFQRRHDQASLVAYDAVLLLGYLVRWPVFVLADLAAPGRGYGEAARFSRRYVWIMLRLMGRG
jgi:GT2 family glycosyltransferase